MDKKTMKKLIISYAVVLILVWSFLSFLYLSGILMFESRHDRNPFVLSIVLFTSAMALLMVFAIIGIGCYVHADARRRGMNPVLWTLVAIFVPYFIGLIVYLINRRPLPSSCPACGAAVSEDSIFCPHCGRPLKRQCPACKSMIEGNFRFCPKCGAPVGT